MNKIRKYSLAVCGGAFGDEGKGRIVDNYVSEFAKTHKVVLYRDNGGANAGHTVEVGDVRIALHQLPSGVFTQGATIVLGKGMVIHPGDLLMEIQYVKDALKGEIKSEIKIDQMAVLTLDTHRAFEGVLKQWQEGGKGSTGRGISPAYSDVLLRHPLRARDLKNWNIEKIQAHYRLYSALISGLGQKIEDVQVNKFDGTTYAVGSEQDFINRLKEQTDQLKDYIEDVFEFINIAWKDENHYAFVFEKAQAIGLDPRYGVYPDVTASDCTFGGINSSTEGAVDSFDIEYKVAVIKATYMSSVGVRKIPTLLEGELAEKIREDAHEYGATTKRPRGIAYLDLPALKFYKNVGYVNYLGLTHMDIVYPNTPIKICIAYEQNGKRVDYRPDQEFLLTVKPIYEELPTWDQKDIQSAKTKEELPSQAKDFLKFVSDYLELPILMITTGPKREQIVTVNA